MNIKYTGDSYWYVALPYSDPNPAVMTMRYMKALKTVAFFINNDFPVYCPISHWHPVAVEHDLPRGYSFWKKMDKIFIGKASGIIVLMLDGWKDSVGVTDEIEIGKANKLPIMYITEDYLNEQVFDPR